MALTAAPYGLRPVKRADGLPYAGATTQYLIDPAGEATNIFNGSVVFIGNDGYIAIATGTGANATTQAFPIAGSFTGSLGVFVGCEYVNAQGQVIFSQYYPANTTGVVKAYVVDDPNVLFQVQFSVGGIDQSTATGDTATGNSTSAVNPTTVTTTAAFRIVSAVSPLTDAFPDVLVKFNVGYNSSTNAVGR